jgi:hypothetical protein
MIYLKIPLFFHSTPDSWSFLENESESQKINPQIFGEASWEASEPFSSESVHPPQILYDLTELKFEILQHFTSVEPFFSTLLGVDNIHIDFILRRSVSGFQWFRNL